MIYFLKIKGQKIQQYRRKTYALMSATRSVLYLIQDTTPASISILQNPLFPAVWSVVSSTRNLRKLFSYGLLAENLHGLVETFVSLFTHCFVLLPGKGTLQNTNLCNSFHAMQHQTTFSFRLY